MKDAELEYEAMVEDALRGVVKRALHQIERAGFPGEHHFYVTFNTADPGVEISPTLKKQYPQEITIVLQHQFWDLEVEEDVFSVTLSFSGKHEKLRIPFRSLVSFADPSAKFVLKFDRPRLETHPETHPVAQENLSLLSPSGLAENEKAAIFPGPASGENKAKPAAPQKNSGSADVVALDSFRKK